MIYILEKELEENEYINFALKKIYGIGSHHSDLICKKLGFSNNIKIKTLSKDQISKIVKLIDILNLKIGSELTKINSLKLKNFVNIKSYRGLRRLQGLPVRGQRTHTNAKTSKRVR
jgi:small subunit ribosomal protein S13|uniref:Ribosomal protein S13 n=1 Tax=Didymosphenia geminata TaxID=1115533 RepID=A0A1L4BMB1_9STRA|nr:ribosomal protein S13 [Didymosphenia geminata]API83099.1 ribosomal protein S13 [Didymosphenia geminata]